VQAVPTVPVPQSMGPPEEEPPLLLPEEEPLEEPELEPLEEPDEDPPDEPEPEPPEEPEEEPPEEPDDEPPDEPEPEPPEEPDEEPLEELLLLPPLEEPLDEPEDEPDEPEEEPLLAEPDDEPDELEPEEEPLEPDEEEPPELLDELEEEPLDDPEEEPDEPEEEPLLLPVPLHPAQTPGVPSAVQVSRPVAPPPGHWQPSCWPGMQANAVVPASGWDGSPLAAAECGSGAAPQAKALRESAARPANSDRFMVGEEWYGGGTAVLPAVNAGACSSARPRAHPAPRAGVRRGTPAPNIDGCAACPGACEKPAVPPSQ
jgi:hypothetical protein